MSIIKKMFSFSLLETSGAGKDVKAVKYPGVRDAVDGNTGTIRLHLHAHRVIDHSFQTDQNLHGFSVASSPGNFRW